MRSPDEARTTTTLTRRFLAPLAILLALSGCGDGLTTLDQVPFGPEFSQVTALPPVLQQSPAAPPLETYQASVWAPVNKAATITVNYLPASDGSVGEPFLRLDIPRNSLVAGPGGVPLARNDSVLITVTIDPVNFQMDFQPSGLLFSPKASPNLTVWWTNANLDLNGNGVVDGWDWNQLQQLSFWYQATATTGYKLKSLNDTAQKYLSTALYHFSQYAVSF